VTPAVNDPQTSYADKHPNPSTSAENSTPPYVFIQMSTSKSSEKEKGGCQTVLRRVALKVGGRTILAPVEVTDAKQPFNRNMRYLKERSCKNWSAARRSDEKNREKEDVWKLDWRGGGKLPEVSQACT